MQARIPLLFVSVALLAVVAACGGSTATPTSSLSGTVSPSPSGSRDAPPPTPTPTPEPTLDQEYVVHAVRAIDELRRILDTADAEERTDLAAAWLLAEGQWVGENGALAEVGGPLGEYAAVVREAVGAHANGDDIEESLLLLRDLRASIAALAEAGATADPAAVPMYLPGEAMRVPTDGDAWLEIVVDRVTTSENYEGPRGVDVPDLDNVYIQFEVTYRALADGIDYDPLDWRIATDGVAGDEPSPVLNGPEPALSPGTLFTDDEATGWVVFEVPATGRVVAGYTGSAATDGALFEVLLRRR